MSIAICDLINDTDIQCDKLFGVFHKIFLFDDIVCRDSLLFGTKNIMIWLFQKQKNRCAQKFNATHTRRLNLKLESSKSRCLLSSPQNYHEINTEKKLRTTIYKHCVVVSPCSLSFILNMKWCESTENRCQNQPLTKWERNNNEISDAKTRPTEFSVHDGKR